MMYEITYQLTSGIHEARKCGTDDDLRNLIADLLAEGIDAFQVKHLQCAHRWTVAEKGQIPQDWANWHTFRCERCGDMLTNVLDAELSALHEARQS